MSCKNFLHRFKSARPSFTTHSGFLSSQPIRFRSAQFSTNRRLPLIFCAAAERMNNMDTFPLKCELSEVGKLSRRKQKAARGKLTAWKCDVVPRCAACTTLPRALQLLLQHVYGGSWSPTTSEKVSLFWSLRTQRRWWWLWPALLHHYTFSHMHICRTKLCPRCARPAAGPQLRVSQLPGPGCTREPRCTRAIRLTEYWTHLGVTVPPFVSVYWCFLDD